MSIKSRIDRIEKELKPSMDTSSYQKRLTRESGNMIQGFMKFGLSENDAKGIVDDFCEHAIESYRKYGPGLGNNHKYDINRINSGAFRKSPQKPLHDTQHRIADIKNT